MKKKVSKDWLDSQLVLGYGGGLVAADAWLANAPEDSNGVELDTDEIVRDFRAFFLEYLNKNVGEYTHDDLTIPFVPEPDEPEGSNKVRIPYTGDVMSWNSELYPKFVFPKLGPDYTSKSFTIKYSDGNSLWVPNPKHYAMKPDNTKYQPGGIYSNNNPDIPTMEVYAPRNRPAPEWVEAVFQHAVDTTVPEEPVTPVDPDDGWETINWGGDPNESSEGRSRLWWTKIHGSGETRWWRKFPLPVWLDDKSYQVDFKFSSGRTFYVSDSRQMAMDANGPKYLPQHSNEPNKQHPKIAEEYGKNETWVKFKVRK